MNTIPEQQLDNLVFHIGMIELISYWKAACPPMVEIHPFELDEGQVSFWKKLFFNGLGEFFYTNNIRASIDDFMTIKSSSVIPTVDGIVSAKNDNVVIPVGGGKDSALTLELFHSYGRGIPFMINPRKASLDTIKLAGYNIHSSLVVKRTLDPLLLDLNKQGFLNGHTPFSALVAFVSLLSAAFTGSQFIALSNESSADEPTVQDGPNHQYSKSLDFETDFRMYVKKYISPDIEYFSLLRPLNELGIAYRFSHYPKYLNFFQSCNVGSKTDSWCGNCPKCLFTAIILSPFVPPGKLHAIFRKDIFDDPELLNTLDELIGKAETKPFECVGTIDEVNLALTHTIKHHSEPLPFLLQYYKQLENFQIYKNRKIDNEIQPMGRHFVPPSFMRLLNKR